MPKQVGRYVICDELASGGMATVHLGLVRGEGGFRRVVAIKRLHPHLSREAEFVDMFRDEAHIASRLRHPNIVAVLDVVADADELLLVMEYVHGEALSRIASAVVARGERIPVDIAAALAIDLLSGLHGAHEATSLTGQPLHVVHRDVSPQNVLVSLDGQARLTDFGIAKAVGQLHESREGEIRGKSAYIAPEQIRGDGVDRRADIYSAAVVFWEMLTGRRLFTGENAMERMIAVLEAPRPAPSSIAPEAAPLDAIVTSGIARSRDERPATALAMVDAIEAAVRPASKARVAEWLEPFAGGTLRGRAERVAAIEAAESMAGLEIALPASPSSSLDDRDVETLAREGPPPSAFTPAERPAARSRASVALVVGALVVCAGAGGTALAIRRARASAPSPATSAPTNASASVSASTASTPLDSSSSVAPVASSVARPIKRGPAAPTPPRHSAPSCNPPYVVDANGYRVPKRECL